MSSEKQTTTIVDAPNVTLADGQNAGDLLLNFYRALGWNGKDSVDPRKVRTTEAVYNRLCNQMYELRPDAIVVGMFMCNRGPGTDADIPVGQVYLYEGWITPTDSEEGGKVDEQQ